MTTITYKDGIIAYYSFQCDDDSVANPKAVNSVEREGVKFFFSGVIPDQEFLIKAFLGEKSTEKSQVCAFAFDGEKLWLTAVDQNLQFWKQEIGEKEVRAIGSGREFALGSMDAGSSAVEAVKISCNRDLYSGGEVHSQRIFKSDLACFEEHFESKVEEEFSSSSSEKTTFNFWPLFAGIVLIAFWTGIIYKYASV